ncbi:6232_t:CDS:10, partial [Ambispora leptoticha]
MENEDNILLKTFNEHNEVGGGRGGIRSSDSLANSNLMITLPLGEDSTITLDRSPNAVQNFLIEQELKQRSNSISLQTALTNLSYIAIWYFFSTALSFYNKYLMGKHKFNLNLPILVSALHSGMHFLITSVLMRGTCSAVYRKSSMESSGKTLVSRQSYMSRVVPTAIAAALEICMSNASLVFITLSFYTMVKSSSPIWVLVFSFIFRLEQPRLILVAIILIISLGVVLTVAGETKFNLAGFILVLGSAIISGLRWSITQMLLQKEEGINHPIATLYYLSPIMCSIMTVLSLIIENPFAQFANSPHFRDAATSLHTFVLMLSGGFLAFCMTIAEFALIKNTSTVTLSVAGISKELLIIGLSVLINHDKLTNINLLGTMPDVISKEDKKQNNQKKTEPQIEQETEAHIDSEISLDTAEEEKTNSNNNSSTPSIASSASNTDSSGKKKKSSSLEAPTDNSGSSKFRLFRVWGNNQDSEYKALEKALGRFQSKDRYKVDILKTLVIPWLKKNNSINVADKYLQHGRMVLLKWWNILIANLPNAAYTDRTLYFEYWIGPLPQSDRGDSYNGIPIESIISYRGALLSTLSYAIDRLNQKGVYSNVISFCARVLALCFFKIPSVGFALLQGLPVKKLHIKRMLTETVGDFESNEVWIRKQNEKILPIFPDHLNILCFSNLQSWWRQFENAKKILGEPPIEMAGNWIRRWQSDDSELFFSFYKHYHVVLKNYLSPHLSSLATSTTATTSPSSKFLSNPVNYITTPGYLHLSAFFLNKIESLVHRNIHTITTVIQFEHPRNVSGGAMAGAGGGNSMTGGGVLEMAGRRFVETLVSIVEHDIYEDMCNHWIKAVVKKTNMYDVEGVFCLLDFLDTLIMELDGRDSIDTSNDHQIPDNININFSTSFSSISSSSSSSSAGGLINILDIPFYLSLIKLLLSKSDHTITLLRTLSFIYTHFYLLTSKPSYLDQLVKDLLLGEEMFERLFCHWSRNVRIYFIRLLIWRVSRVAGGAGLAGVGNGFLFGNGEGIRAGIFEEEIQRKKKEPIDSAVSFDANVEESIIDRIENIRLCHEFFSNYVADSKSNGDALGKAVTGEENGESAASTENTHDKRHSSINNNYTSNTNNDTKKGSKTSASPTPSRQNSNQKKKKKVKDLIAMQPSASASTSGKNLSSAACLFRWMLPTPSLSSSSKNFRHSYPNYHKRGSRLSTY